MAGMHRLTPPRIAVVDADRRVRTSLADVLSVAGAEVVGMAGDVRSALALAESAGPDAVLVDPRLPDLEAGLALVSSLRIGWPDLRVVLMGWADDGESRLHDAGVSFVPKSAGAEESLAAALDACRCD